MILEVIAVAIVARVHFDGKVIIPDEPVDLPVGETIEAEFRVPEGQLSAEEIKKRRAAIKRLASMAIHGLNIPDFALSRESIYWPPRGL